MKANKKLIQIFLISIGFLIIIGTYLLYPKIEKDRLKGSVVENEQPLIKDDENAVNKFEELGKLYKKAGVNPLGGCIPMLLQMPILFALFRFFPASIELRQKSFLWATDLSTYDSVLDLPFEISNLTKLIAPSIKD